VVLAELSELDESEGPAAALPAATLKLEQLQCAGSFKARGAFTNLLLRQVPPAGVVAASGGNHGVAVAYAAHRLGVPAKIFVPTVSAPTKIERIRQLGADLVVTGERYADALAAAQDWERSSGAMSVHAYDQRETILGQGTLALELAEQVRELDTVLVPVGGGGLIGGVAVAIKSARPDVAVIGVQAQEIAAMRGALTAGAPVEVAAATTIADGIAVRRVGKETFELARRYVDQVVTVTEEEIANAILLLLEIEKTVVEGAGAVPLAALANQRVALAGRTVALVVSGGNIDVNVIARVIERGLVKDGRLVRLRVRLRDRPGTLARLASLVAAARANVLRIEHDRAFSRAPVGDTEVELTLETSGPEQIETLKRQLTEAGYFVEEVAPS